jgi:putative acetyltransferase
MEAHTVRRERPEDREQVFRVNVLAFEDDTEAKLVDLVRPIARPLVSLVASLEGRIVGHILFTPVTVENTTKPVVPMALGPMAVVPEHQRGGIGSSLVYAGLEECEAAGADAIFVVGHAEYYPRFGFEPAASFGLRFKSEAFDPHFFVRETRPGVLDCMSGYVYYLPQFDQS